MIYDPSISWFWQIQLFYTQLYSLHQLGHQKCHRKDESMDGERGGDGERRGEGLAVLFLDVETMWLNGAMALDPQTFPAEVNYNEARGLPRNPMP